MLIKMTLEKIDKNIRRLVMMSRRRSVMTNIVSVAARNRAYTSEEVKKSRHITINSHG
jgi:hypothetical protein